MINDQNIIGEDEYFVFVNKPAGIPMRSEEGPSIESEVKKLLSKKVYVTHHLDQVVSGICILAKTKEAVRVMHVLLRNNALNKKYLAVVPSGTAKDSDSFSLSLFHDTKLKKSFVNERKGKSAELQYVKKQQSDRYDLLEVEIKQGRFHQIRSMLAHQEMPIKGDVKYGARRKNKGRFIHLHAHSITFPHPLTSSIVSFSAPLPQDSLWQFFADSIANETS